MQHDSSRSFRERIAKEEEMDPMLNGHSPEVSKNIKTKAQVLCELLEMIVDRLPSVGPDVDDMRIELDTRALLKAYLDIVMGEK
jgi:hypothetical protein